MDDLKIHRANGSLRASGGQGRTGSRSMRYDRDRSLHDIVREQAGVAPDATAVVFGERSITYGELDRLSSALALHLVRIGVRKGDTVGLFLPRALNTIIATLAILKAGGAYVPIDPAFPLEHLDYVVGECAPKVIFADAASGGKISEVPSLRGGIVDLDAALSMLAEGPAVEAPAIAIGGGDMAYVMYTSGSTGRPKGVAIAHRGIARVVLDQNYIDFERGDVVLHTATIAFDAATFEIWGALLNGCTLAGMPDASFSLARLCDVIRGNGVTVTLLTTGLFNLFADYAGGNLPTLRHVLFGGEVGSAEHVRRFFRMHPDCRLTNAYGPTETTVLATAFTVPPGFAEPELPIGRVVSHTGIRVVDDELHELPDGVEGQLAISGDGLAIGYLNRPDLTEEKFVTVGTAGGPLRCYLTGDLAILNADGTVTFKGRRDRQIKINGKRIELDEIEAALRRDPRLADGVVVCHPQGQQAQGLLTQGHAVKRIVAYLRPNRKGAGSDPDFVRAVFATLRAALPAYMIPSCAVVLDEFPMNQAGKIERSKLPPPPVEAVQAAAPESRSEAILTGLWQDVLGSQGIELDRNFFDLGGTSLQLLRVHAGLEAALGRSIDVVALFKHPTIRDLACFLDGKTPETTRSMSAAERAARQKKTMSQFRRSAT